jgi:hypothetical protein
MQLGIKQFPIRQLIDDDGEELMEEEDYNRLMRARADDHLMTPFQCETCHVRICWEEISGMTRPDQWTFERNLLFQGLKGEASLRTLEI